MLRWTTLFCSALLILTAVAYVIPVKDYFLELQPDGTNLGRVSGGEVRIVAIGFGTLTLIILAALAKISRARLQTSKRQVMFVGSSLGCALLALGFVLFLIRN